MSSSDEQGPIWRDGDEWYAITHDEPEGIGPFDTPEEAAREFVARDQRRCYLIGRYDACATILTSPRMNRPQREVIQDVAGRVRDELEAIGVVFNGPHPSGGHPAPRSGQ